jgi:hypothetical protein
MADPLPLELHPDRFGLAHLAPDAALPAAWAAASPCFLARTPDELSVVAPLEVVERVVPSAGAFRLLGIALVFGTTETGVLKRLLDPLAAASVWVLAIGSHDTDWLLVREDQLARALEALRAAGHVVRIPDEGPRC